MTRAIRYALAAGLCLAGCSFKDADAVALPPSSKEPAAASRSGAPDAGAIARAGAGESTARDVPYSGTVEPHRRSTLMPKIPSTVARVHAREGDRAREGDPLVTFDVKDVKLRLRQARAALEAAKVQRDAAAEEWRITKDLFERNVAAKAQYDGVEFKKRGTEAGVEAAEVGVEMAHKAVRDSVVRAPFDCFVVRRMVNEGDFAMTMPPTPLLVVEEIGTLDLRVLVPSSEADNIREGDRVTIRFPSLEKTLEAAVTRIVPSVDPRTRSFSVIVEIPNADGALLPGLFAEARFPSAAPFEARP